MPIYEYACNTCGHRFEVFQKMSDPAPSTCPSCGAEEPRKLVSAAAFVLKGGGWYKDHYGLKSGTSSAESSGASSSGDAAKSGDSSSGATSSTPSTPSGSGGASSAGSSAPASSSPAPAAPAKP